MENPVVIHVAGVGRLGNQMIQYMAALFLASRIPNSALSGVDLPDWSIHEPDKRRDHRRSFVIRRDTMMRMPIEEILEKVAAGEIDCIEIENYVQHVDNFLSPVFYRAIFRQQSLPRPPAKIADDELLINVRGEEVLFAVAPDYVTLPVDYLVAIVEETRLRPVIMGQLTPGPYLDQLRERFPEARFIGSEGAMVDFEVIRGARNIVISISSFSWLAAFLSNAERIFFPVAGLFNPYQRPDIMMLPLRDERYRFDVFPIYFALPFGEALVHHARITGLWRRLPGSHVERRLSAGPRFGPDFERMAELFDEEFYLLSQPDIARAKESGAILSGAEHYFRVGAQEGRWPFNVDRVWYCHEYPEAAAELSTGEFRNLPHHYAAVGQARNYRPTPPQ